MFLLVGIFLISLISAQVSYCCEKTKVNADGTGGMWCQNDEEENCDIDFQVAPTLCESTSYCRKGCCYNSQEGDCIRNTAQRTCQESGGVWEDSADCDIPQCELGCCLIGEQAAFVTQTKCKRFSSLYGLNISFRRDISSEVECIASSKTDVKGACVFEKDFETTCLMLTQKQCIGRMASNEGVEFYEGQLCSNPSLLTNCGYPGGTTCVEGKDQVYFTDTCGNLANIYDSTKLNNADYWSYMKDPIEVCGYGQNNANSETCGNCDYFLGSTCKAYDRGEDNNAPDYGDYICRDLSCEWKGDVYAHGETWCDSEGGVSNIDFENVKETNPTQENLPGSRYFRLACYNGEVTIEPCAEFRQQVCVESSINGFSTAACRVNRWEDCVGQDNEEDCENDDERDCKWVPVPVSGVGICVPRYAPGFDFWQSQEDAEDMCNIGTLQCKIKYEKAIGGTWECVENCECEESYQQLREGGQGSWIEAANQICASLGDCGSSMNYINEPGHYSLIDLFNPGRRRR
jgi:hypothetical protein